MDVDDSDDPVVARLPIRFSNALDPQIQIHQFPLLTRPLQVPPPAAAAGKRIKARLKPNAHRFEIHVPVDTRPEVWNQEKAEALGAAQLEDDKEKNQEPPKVKQRREEEPRLSEVRMQSEPVPQKGVYVLGIVRDGQLHLHPISETHQLRPTLTYLDVFSRKNKRSRGDDDSDSDDGPPPDPDEPAPPPAPKKEKKPAGEVKEIQVAARRAAGDDKSLQGGLSTARREMLMILRAEEDEAWEDLEAFGSETAESSEAFESVFSKEDRALDSQFQLSTFVTDIQGL